jgi:SAM-dependent methyltransferase
MGTTETQTENRFRLGDYILGIQGLAILRESTRREFDRMAGRRGEAGGILAGYEAEPLNTPRDLPDANLNDGYTTWAETYDHPEELDPDPIQALEGPVMREFMDGLPDGPVLDAACGTGRHTKYLADRGHKVLGVDGNEAMLEHAKKKIPDAEFEVGDLSKLPAEDASYGALTCGLAFGHLEDLAPAAKEIARVLSPGGVAAVSAPHAFITGILGWRAPVFDTEGNGWQVPEYPHWPGELVQAFTGAGLTVTAIHEPKLTSEMALWNPEAEEGEENPFADAFIDALEGQPGAQVVVVEKRA